MTIKKFCRPEGRARNVAPRRLRFPSDAAAKAEKIYRRLRLEYHLIIKAGCPFDWWGPMTTATVNI